MRPMKKSAGFWKRKINVLAAVLLGLSVISCSTVAFTGRNRLLLYSDTDIFSLSDQSYSQLMATSVRSSDTKCTVTVTEVGRRMTSALQAYLTATGQSDVLNGITWSFDLVKNSQANAFCLPNGRVVFYEGIMPVLDTPDLVAVVMGHEMGHVIARHGNERMSRQALVSLVGAVAGQAVGQKTSQNVQALFEAAFSIGSEYGYLLPYSRKHEYEADEIGLYLMAIAGYDISQATTLWTRMSQATAQSVPEYLSTHPSDANRIKHLEKLQSKARSLIAR